MQVVQLMHGIQLCLTTVKVSWAKLFPEDVQDEGGDVGDELHVEAESFPMKMALVKEEGLKKFTLTSVAPSAVVLQDNDFLESDDLLNNTSADVNKSTGVAKGGHLADGDDIGETDPVVPDQMEEKYRSVNATNPSSDDSTESRVAYVKTNAKDFFLLDYLLVYTTSFLSIYTTSLLSIYTTSIIHIYTTSIIINIHYLIIINIHYLYYPYIHYLIIITIHYLIIINIHYL